MEERSLDQALQGLKSTRSTGEGFLSYMAVREEPDRGSEKGVGRAGAWATFTAHGQGLCSHSAPFRPPSPSSKSYSFLPASPQEIPAPARRSVPPVSPPPPPPHLQAEALEGALAGIRKVWETLTDFFSLGDPSLPRPLGPLRFLWLGLGREGLSWGKAKA